VIDPIDGTRAFISGLPLWGTLVGLLEDGRAVAGMMSQPFTGELFSPAAARAGARTRADRRRSRPADRFLTDAILCTTTPALFEGAKREAYDRVERSVRLARYGTDCYAYAMLAAGQVDLVVEAGLQAYDIVGLVPLIEAAGGVVTTWDGGRPESGGDIVAAATPALHAAALRCSTAENRPRRRLFGSGNEGVEGRPELVAIDVALLQELVARAVDRDDRGAAQAPAVGLDGRGRNHFVCAGATNSSGSAAAVMNSGSCTFRAALQAACIQATVGFPVAEFGMRLIDAEIARDSGPDRWSACWSRRARASRSCGART
jgi:hypothetical protein